METVYLPNFLKDLPDIEIFRRLEVFTNLSVKFTSRMTCGIDKSVKTMKTLLEHPPLEGQTAINNVLDLLKDIVLAYQAVKLTGNVHLPLDSNGLTPKKETVIKYKILPKATKNDVSKLLNSLSDAVAEHKAVMTNLRHARQRFINIIKSRSEQAQATQAISETSFGAPVFTTQSVTTQVTHTQSATTQVESDSSLGTSVSRSTQSQTTLKAGKGKRKSVKKIIKEQEEISKAYTLRVFRDRERKVRKDRLNQAESTVRNFIEDRIISILAIGHSRLTEFGKHFDLPEEVMDKLDRFDINHEASKIYNQLSTRYIYPTFENYTNNTEMPLSWFESPNLRAQDKDEIRLGKSGSSMNLLEEDQNEKKREELYVWASQDSGQNRPEQFLGFHAGQKLKQKFCSCEGSIAFGWKRSRFPGSKTYGFYSTSSVSLAP